MAALFCSFLNASVIDSANILSEEVELKLNEIGAELFAKTGVNLDIVTVAHSTKSLHSLVDPYISKATKPYAILAIMPKDSDSSGKVDIFASNDVLMLFDKDAVLSPYPERGSIIPILVAKNAKDIYNAAMLNGYADIAERIAKTKGVELKTSIGNTNRDILNLLRYGIYGFLFGLIGLYFYKKSRARQNV